MSNATLPKTTAATVYGVTEAVSLFTRIDHDGWAVQLNSQGHGAVSYRIIVVDIPEVIFEFICDSLGIRDSVEIDY